MFGISAKVKIVVGKNFGKLGVVVDNVNGYWGVQVDGVILYYRVWELELENA